MNTKQANIQSCPICTSTVSISQRYPNHLCPQCAGKAVDANGRELEFYNTAMSGGFEARFKDDKKPADEVTEGHIVFVDGIKIWADEARFGGIVLEPCKD